MLSNHPSAKSSCTSKAQVAMQNDNPYQPPRSVNDPLPENSQSIHYRAWKKIFLLLLLAMVAAIPLFIAALIFNDFAFALRAIALVIMIGINCRISFISAGFTEKTRRGQYTASAPWFLIWAFIQIALNFFAFAAITLIFARS